MITQEQTMAMDQFWTTYAGKGFELVRGRPKEMPAQGHTQGVVNAMLVIHLANHVRAYDLGRVYNANTGFRLGHNVLRVPSAAFIAKGLLNEVDRGEHYVPVAPDLAVKVIAPRDTAQDIHDMVYDFLRAGTRLMWVVYPASRRVVVHHPDGQSQTLNSGAALEGEDVLPGFSLVVNNLFPAV
jgi:Uma2 family endonuclease